MLPVTPFTDQHPGFEVDPSWAKTRASCTAHTLSVSGYLNETHFHHISNVDFDPNLLGTKTYVF